MHRERAELDDGAPPGVGVGPNMGRSKGGQKGPVGTEASSRDPAEWAREICLQRLSFRPHTRMELAQVLQRRGVPESAADEVLERFGEVGLIDDQAFAQAWVSTRHNGRGLARRALANELRRKGVDNETVGDAVSALTDETERNTADALVAKKLRTMRDVAPDAAFRRLVGMLARKGYSAAIAVPAVREALAIEAEIEIDDSTLTEP